MNTDKEHQESIARSVREIVEKSTQVESLVGLLFLEPLRVEIVGRASNFDLIVGVSAILRTVLLDVEASLPEHPKTKELRELTERFEAMVEIGAPSEQQVMRLPEHGHH